MTSPRRPTLLLISQVYVPDPASVGQHLHDVATEMARRGWRVIVYASARGYDDPSRRYTKRETVDGVEIRRLAFSSFGKNSILARLLGGGLFTAQATLRALGGPVDVVLVSTSPPLAPLAGVALRMLRRARVKFWVMDLNPDQMVQLGKVGPRSLPTRLFDTMNRAIYGAADDVVALDRFMAERILRKVRDPERLSQKLTVMPPWPHEDHLAPVAHEDNPFRREHGLEGKFVIMYSGNHGVSTPLTTVLEAALRLRDRDDVVFMFIGGGAGKKEVERVIAERRPPNIRSLPYQPLDRIRWSLSAADVHLVSMSNDLVGVVHPCKVYGAMAVARPILLIGPDPCHVSDLLRENDIGWHIPHGDVDGGERVIRQIVETDAGRLRQMGQRARAVIASSLSKEALCGRLCNVLEANTTRAHRGGPEAGSAPGDRQFGRSAGPVAVAGQPERRASGDPI